DRLLRERAHEVPVTRTKVGDRIVGEDLTARALVDAMDALLDPIGVHEAEPRACRRRQRDLPGDGIPSELGPEPPLLVVQTFGRHTVPHVVPVEISTLGIRGLGLHRFGDDRGRAALDDARELRWYDGDLQNELPDNY